MNIEALKDKLAAFRDTVSFVRHGRSPRSIADRVRMAPHVMRERHVIRIVQRYGTKVDPEYVKYIENVLKGTADGTEEYPLCDVCLTAFSPGFTADDGFHASDKTCAGCLRTREKDKERESERDQLLSEPDHVDPAPAVQLPRQDECVERSDDSAEERPVRP